MRILRQYFSAKKLQSQNVTREKVLKVLSYEKFPSKMLMKLIPLTHGVNFINICSFFVQKCFAQLYSTYVLAFMKKALLKC
jgi:hypothetical protein